MTCGLPWPAYLDTMTRMLVSGGYCESGVCEGISDGEISRAPGPGLLCRVRLCNSCATLLGCAWSLVVVGNKVCLRPLAFFGGET